MLPFTELYRLGSRLVQLIALCSISVYSILAAGELDPGFTGSAYGVLPGNVSAIRIQPDGKYVIGGLFQDVNGVSQSAVARVNADGTVDTTFKSPDIYGGFGIGYQVLAVALQPDGKILIGGSFYGAEGVFRPGIRRLNTDGSLDSSFFVEELPIDQGVYDIEVQSDGKIVVGGNLLTGVKVLRFNSDGTRDTSFTAPQSNDVRDIEIQSDGKILTGSINRLSRLTTTGALDGTFAQVTATGNIEAVKVLPSGKILIGGSFTEVNGFTVGRIALVNSDGSVDLTFNLNNPGANGTVSDIALRSNGKILIGGGFATYNSVSRVKIAQLNSDGTLDTNFQNNTLLNLAFVNDVELAADGRLLVGINWQTGTPSFTRFNLDGTRDLTFEPIIARTGSVRRILQQPDGKILACGEFQYAGGLKRLSLARFNTDGTVDSTFIPYWNGQTPIPVMSAMSLQADGKIVVELNGVPRRLNADGSQDTFTATVSGTITDLVALPNGQILVGGQLSAGRIVRLNSNGSTDTSFAPVQPTALVNKVLLQPDGKILIGGDFTNVGASIRGRIARLNGSDGSLDGTFSPPGGANGTVTDIDLQTDGKIILVGNFSSLNGAVNTVRIGRLNSDGTLDSGFAAQSNAGMKAVKIQPDGKILVGGANSTINGIARNGIARLNSDGSVDSSFDTFANTQLWEINMQADGKILIGGEFTRIDGNSAVRIARLTNNTAPLRTLFDYDGDLKSDVSVFRPSTNRWYVFKSSDATVFEQTFGLGGDIITPADFDGDGKTDLAIFRPAAGDWWYLASTDGTQRSVHWGASGDIPRPSDFDGDGKTDFIVFRPSDNNWYRLGSAGASSVVNFGLAGDKPVTGDFDGDGKSDPAIYRPSTGDWWWRSSLNGAQLATHWGITTDTPAPADFDGDGKTDFAVYRASSGTWYILNSGNGQATITNFGIAEDKPVPADYDGDGRADVAVFRPSTGVWYAVRSTAGFTSMQFGVSSDIPTENAFVP